jgi:hypothetical protein
MQTTASTVQRTAAASHQAIQISQETKAITKEVAEAGKAAAVILQETNNIAKAIQSAFPEEFIRLSTQQQLSIY